MCVELSHIAEMLKEMKVELELAATAQALSDEIRSAIMKHSIVNHPEFGKIYAFEVDGYGSAYCMDDANVPSLLSLPYLNFTTVDDKVYQNTRNFVLSSSNPYFFEGSAGKGIGGPHCGLDMVWPMSSKKK